MTTQTPQLQPLERTAWNTAQLVRDYPPQWTHPNKQALFDHINAIHQAHVKHGNANNACEITYARWPATALPLALAPQAAFIIQPDVFTYNHAHMEVAAPTTTTHWHMNFADTNLFCAYAGPLFAQDELQVAEHPALASLLEALIATGKSTTTMNANNSATPITISGVPRRCGIDTQPNVAAGCAYGLYGNHFQRAAAAHIIRATTVFTPPTISNILALAAPGYQSGRYTLEQIHSITSTAYSGYLSALLHQASAPRAIIHTGFWGCGAFGGNRNVMVVLQALAANLAGVDIVFHAVNVDGARQAQAAHEQFAQMMRRGASPSAVIELVHAAHFEWDASDGN